MRRELGMKIELERFFGPPEPPNPKGTHFVNAFGETVEPVEGGIWEFWENPQAGYYDRFHVDTAHHLYDDEDDLKWEKDYSNCPDTRQIVFEVDDED
jgi:hypothetical protein